MTTRPKPRPEVSDALYEILKETTVSHSTAHAVTVDGRQAVSMDEVMMALVNTIGWWLSRLPRAERSGAGAFVVDSLCAVLAQVEVQLPHQGEPPTPAKH